MTPPRATEHRKTATRAGLNYVTDGLPGISRRRAGKGWAFYRPSGALIAAAKERDRIKSLVIPPAWTDVWICRDPKGHIQVTARDARGRKQYRYHPDYREARDSSKFRRILELSEVIPTIREHAELDLRAGQLSRSQILATVVQLLDKTLIRVGSDEYAKENRSYGLTTLRAKHVQVQGDELSYQLSRQKRCTAGFVDHRSTDRPHRAAMSGLARSGAVSVPRRSWEATGYRVRGCERLPR